MLPNPSVQQKKEIGNAEDGVLLCPREVLLTEVFLSKGFLLGVARSFGKYGSRAFWSNSPALTPEKPSLSANISPWLPLEPSSLTRNQMIRKILLHFIPLNHGQKISVAGERQRKNGERHLWILHLWMEKCWSSWISSSSIHGHIFPAYSNSEWVWHHKAVNCALDGPICDLKLLWGPWSDWGWMALGSPAYISGPAEVTGVRLVSICHSQTCVQERSKIHFTSLVQCSQRCFPGINEQTDWQLREQQRPLTLWNANFLLPIRDLSNWKQLANSN